jgi:hypothetical protein
MMSNSNPKSTPITVYSQDKYCYGNVYSHWRVQKNESRTKKRNNSTWSSSVYFLLKYTTKK